jgi:hypothetical protein
MVDEYGAKLQAEKIPTLLADAGIGLMCFRMPAGPEQELRFPAEGNLLRLDAYVHDASP